MPPETALHLGRTGPSAFVSVIRGLAAAPALLSARQFMSHLCHSVVNFVALHISGFFPTI
jgi:hypothetical protein